MGPYIVQCNATTGARESYTRLAAAPIYGEMPIVYHPGTAMLFVGSGLTPNKQINNAWVNDPPQYKDIYKMNPVSKAIVATGMQSVFNSGFGPGDGLRGGPYHLIADGDYVVYLFLFCNSYSSWGRIHATTYANNGYDVFRLHYEQIAVDANYCYTLDPYQRELQIYNKTLDGPGSYITSPSIAPHNAMGCCYSTLDGKVWIVCSNDTILRMNSTTDLDYTTFSLLGVSGPTVPPDPCRVQCLSDGMLYLPCMSANGVIVFNPLTGTGTWKDGFEGPMDVVETPTKKFAIQNSPVGLKEIT